LVNESLSHFSKDDTFILICGDFNEEPQNKAIAIMKSQFKSAASEVFNGSEFDCTTFKYRERSGF
jgi:endonuclease/exonuclease/phosphatase family metal-dependent hydrolase